MNAKTVVIMAAGIGSRYGGDKQLDRFGPGQQTLLDYSIYDAIQTGFQRVILIIRREKHQEFIERIDRHIGDGRIAIDYAFQEMDNLPKNYITPNGRAKPWGTAHALFCALPQIASPALVINADDFYGRGPFAIAANMLDRLPSNKMRAGMVGFTLLHTLSKYGKVSRGICAVDRDNHLIDIQEVHGLHQDIASSPDGPISSDAPIILNGHETVSMNMWLFTPAVLRKIPALFAQFLSNNLNDPTTEFLIPHVVQTLIDQKELVVDVEQSHAASWFGVTVSKDRETTDLRLDELIKNGEYPEKLWE